MRTAGLILLTLTLLTAPIAAAGTVHDPEIVDPQGDAVHLETGQQESSLDVTKVWLQWRAADDTLVVTLEVRNLTNPGPAGTNDPIDGRTYLDVYWDHAGSNEDGGDPYVARFRMDNDGAKHFLAGRAPVITRDLVYPPDGASMNIHGDVSAASGGLVEGAPGYVVIEVYAGAVGDPGPGDTLTNLRFASYVDHHQGVPGAMEHHHPGHVDANNETGRDYTIPVASADGDGDGSGKMGGGDGDRSTPAAGAAWVAVTLVAVASLARTRWR